MTHTIHGCTLCSVKYPDSWRSSGGLSLPRWLMQRPKHKHTRRRVHVLNLAVVDPVRIRCQAVTVQPRDKDQSADYCVLFLIHTSQHECTLFCLTTVREPIFISHMFTCSSFFNINHQMQSDFKNGNTCERVVFTCADTLSASVQICVTNLTIIAARVPHHRSVTPVSAAHGLVCAYSWKWRPVYCKHTQVGARSSPQTVIQMSGDNKCVSQDLHEGSHNTDSFPVCWSGPDVLTLFWLSLVHLFLFFMFFENQEMTLN